MAVLGFGKLCTYLRPLWGGVEDFLGDYEVPLSPTALTAKSTASPLVLGRAAVKAVPGSAPQSLCRFELSPVARRTEHVGGGGADATGEYVGQLASASRGGPVWVAVHHNAARRPHCKHWATPAGTSCSPSGRSCSR